MKQVVLRVTFWGGVELLTVDYSWGNGVRRQFMLKAGK